MDWNTLAPMASLMSAGDVLVQYDQAYERYDTPNPQQVALELHHHPAGPLRSRLLRRPATERLPRAPLRRAGALASGPNQGWTAPLVSYTVDQSPADRPGRVDARPRWSSTGDASGLVDAVVGRPARRQPDHPLRRHARHRADAPTKHPGRAPPTWWSPTPTASRATGGTRSTRTPGTPRPRPRARTRPTRPTRRSTCSPRRRPTPSPPPSSHGIASVTASSYGSSITYLPEDRPAAALDGNTQTAGGRLLRAAHRAVVAGRPSPSR